MSQRPINSLQATAADHRVFGRVWNSMVAVAFRSHPLRLCLYWVVGGHFRYEHASHYCSRERDCPRWLFRVATIREFERQDNGRVTGHFAKLRLAVLSKRVDRVAKTRRGHQAGGCPDSQPTYFRFKAAAHWWVA